MFTVYLISLGNRRCFWETHLILDCIIFLLKLPRLNILFIFAAKEVNEQFTSIKIWIKTYY